MKHLRYIIFTQIIILFSLSLAISQSVFAFQSNNLPLLIPMGEGNVPALNGLVEAASNNRIDGAIRILIMPIAEASNPANISIPERTEIVQRSERTRLSLEAICERTVPVWVSCEIILAPIVTREDTYSSLSAQLFDQSYSAILFTGSDPRMAMQVIGGTPVEQALYDTHEAGAILSGLEGSANLLSTAMLGGFHPEFTAQDVLRFGTVDVWHTSARHGLVFGLQDAIIDHNGVYINNLGRLLNATSLPDSPNIGISAEANSGLHLEENKYLSGTFGSNNVTVLDTDTYHSADMVAYAGCLDAPGCYPLLSLRNVLLHMLAPGESSYDLESRQHSLAPPENRIERNFNALKGEPRAGSLILAGEISTPLDNDPILGRFFELTGNAQPDLVFIFLGYPDESTSQTMVDRYQSVFNVNITQINLSIGEQQSIELPDQMDGIFIFAHPAASIEPDTVEAARKAWLSGVPVLAVSNAAEMLGKYYLPLSSQLQFDPTSYAKVIHEIHVHQSGIQPGLGWVNLSIEGNTLDSDHWGHLISLAYTNPDILVVGLTENAGLIISENDPEAIGQNDIITLDFRRSRLAQGENGAFVIANGLLDLFAPGEHVAPEIAITDMQLTPPATPIVRTPTASPQPTWTLTPSAIPTLTFTPAPPSPTPTRTKRPTATPLPVPPPSDPKSLQWIVAFGVLIVVIILFGIVLNRRKLGV